MTTDCRELERPVPRYNPWRGLVERLKYAARMTAERKYLLSEADEVEARCTIVVANTPIEGIPIMGRSGIAGRTLEITVDYLPTTWKKEHYAMDITEVAVKPPENISDAAWYRLRPFVEQARDDYGHILSGMSSVTARLTYRRIIEETFDYQPPNFEEKNLVQRKVAGYKMLDFKPLEK